MAVLVRKQGGVPVIAPSMREVPLEHNEEAFAFGRSLVSGHFDAVVFLTGVGTRLLWKGLLTRFDEAELGSAFKSTLLVARGPKPSLALRELGFPPDILVPEPNTWRELLETIRPRAEKRVAVQEYGKSNVELIEGLKAQGREVTQVPIYGWDLPLDTGPLRAAAASLAAREIDVVFFTTSMQVVNLMLIAEQEGVAPQVREALSKALIGSIGPTTSETLADYGLTPAFEPTHPKMGLLVNEAAARIGIIKAGNG